MKAPGLLEAVRLRLRLDPAYAGAPAGWTREPHEDLDDPEIERDLRFLQMREREAVQLREDAEAVRHHVAALHAAIPSLPNLFDGDDEPERELRRAGELSVTCAWIADKDDARTLLSAERWRSEALPALLENGEKPRLWRSAWHSLRSWFVRHPADAWLLRHGAGLPKHAKAVLRKAYANDLETRRTIDAWNRVPENGSPRAVAIETLRYAYRHGPAVRRDLLALRTVQSLAVLDVRNYRDLVFRIGDYESDGEDPALGYSLP